MINLYRGVTFGLQNIALFLLKNKKDNVLIEKSGAYKREETPKGPYDIHIHAVSVGEMGVAYAIVSALRSLKPDLKISISVTTRTGYQKAMDTVGKYYPVFYYPFDLPKSVESFLDYVKPRLTATVETEIWPNFFYIASKKNIKTTIINARISKKSFKNYKRIKPFMQDVLKCLSGVSAISERFKERLIQLGTREDIIRVTGNAKFESLLTQPKIEKAEELRKLLDIQKNIKVFTAGSIRTEEAGFIVDATNKIHAKNPDLIIIIVPRHVQNLSIFQELLEKNNLEYQLFTSLQKGEKRFKNIILVDIIGPLFNIYGLSDVAFVGGTLIPVGGHNIMEPAAWGCPVIFGEFIDNVEDAAIELLKNNGGIMVKNTSELVENVVKLINNADLSENMGKMGRKSLEILGKDSATKQAEFLLELLER